MGVNAVAHAIPESGRDLEGAQCMRDQRAQWAGESRMRTHNVWHLAMFDAGDGNVESALGILDAWLLPSSMRSPLDGEKSADDARRFPRSAFPELRDFAFEKVTEAFPVMSTGLRRNAAALPATST